MPDETQYDLSIPSGVMVYLTDTPFASNTVSALTGGFANYVFRMYLRTPYEGRNTMVMKHGKSYVALKTENMAFDIIRQDFEVAALKTVKKLLHEDSIVTVPTVHLFDRKANVIVMDDCGEDSMNLKQLILEKTPSLLIAHAIGDALGGFLARLHTNGKDKETLAYFDGQEQARRLSAMVTYGRLVSTITGKDNLPFLSDPPLDISQATMGVISTIASERTEAIISSFETLTMGDFWPGNILVSLQHGADVDAPRIHRIYVVDWEVTKPGLPGLDVGQLVAELHLLRRFYSHCDATASETISAFLKAYSRSRDVDIALVRTAVVHVGAHLIAWTPRVPTWTSKEKTREVVEEGISYMINGETATEEYLREPPLRELFT